jgi:phosphatidylserine/phosphatidylglycerophosphate/cardiolipin synthase-like enzyme
VHVVTHRGLRDARTLEAYRDLIDGARSHVYAVNGFPLALALLRALRRGVRVRVLVGHVTPTHAGGPFAGPLSSARTLATEFVHSRLDPIAEAGGEVYLFARRDVPGWDPGLGAVHLHVHAKTISVDGRRCAVGSANFDVTSAYWESEVMLLVEEEAVAGPLERLLDEIMAGSTRVDREDPGWRERARRRSWMRRWPGLLSA